MNTLLKSLAILFALNIAISIATADEPNIPASSWEQHSEGIALVLILKERSIRVYIKNTSNILKGLENQGANTFVKFSYVDDHGKSIPLGDHSFYNDDRDDTSKEPGPDDIAPGGEIFKTIAITSDELALVKTHPVICKIVIYDPTTNQKHTIESSPKLLTETSSQ